MQKKVPIHASRSLRDTIRFCASRSLRDTALTLGLLVMAGSAMAQESADDYPTLARVEYVYACMKRRGVENYDSMYGCVCEIDYIRTQFTYDEFSEAEVYRQLRRSPGERGGVFRDPEQAKPLRERLEKIYEKAAKRCTVKKVSVQ